MPAPSVAPKLKPVEPPASRRITLITNHFQMAFQRKEVFRYDVAIKQYILSEKGELVKDHTRGDRDDAASLERQRRCLSLMDFAYEYAPFASRNVVFVYDNSKTLFSSEKLDERKCGQIKLEGNQLPQRFHNHPRLGLGYYMVEITPVSTNHRFFTDDLRKAVGTDFMKQDHSLRQFYEILTNEDAIKKNSHMIFYGNLYDNTKGGVSRKLKEARHLIFGASKGARIIEGTNNKLVAAVVLDSKKSTFFDDMNPRGLVGNIREILQVPPNMLASQVRFQDKHRSAVMKYLKDLRVYHTGHQERTFVVSSISKEPIQDLFFEMGPKRMSVVEYHKNLGARIEYPHWPAVVLQGPRGKSFFPMEILAVSHGQRVPISKQTPTQMSATINDCACKPDIRFREICKNLEGLNLASTAQNPYLEAFGVKVDSSPMKVRAFRRVAPKMVYGNKTVDFDDRKGNWFANCAYVVPAKIDKWFIISDQVEVPRVKKFGATLMEMMRMKKMNFAEPEYLSMPVSQIEGLLKKLNDEIMRGKAPFKQAFVLVIDRDDNSHAYLKLMEAKHQILTQHLLEKTMNDCLAQKKLTTGNIVNKINCKNFGLNYVVSPQDHAKNSYMGKGDVMVLGYDVSHPEPQGQMEMRLGIPPSTPSVVGFSFNGGAHPGAFIGDYEFCKPRQEQVDVMETRIQWMLKVFTRHRKNPPARIVVVRDGVSEGQMPMVLEHEFETIRRGVRAFKEGYTPKFLFVTTTKRHQKRFFAEANGTVENPLPLTVVDREVVRPGVTEFYMQAHKAIKGTAKLPAYTVLVNDLQWSMDEVQSFLMGLCFEHQIVNSPISIPEPVYQADEWAKRGHANILAFFKLMEAVDPATKQPRIMNFLVNVENPQKFEAKRQYDWRRISKMLCYMNKRLEGTRANA